MATNFRLGIKRVLHDLHPGLAMTTHAKSLLDVFLADMTLRIVKEAVFLLS
jgi:hypothetical protein